MEGKGTPNAPMSVRVRPPVPYSKRDWNTHVEACMFSDSIWFGDENYTVWPPVWYKQMLQK